MPPAPSGSTTATAHARTVPLEPPQMFRSARGCFWPSMTVGALLGDPSFFMPLRLAVNWTMPVSLPCSSFTFFMPKTVLNAGILALRALQAS